jgi:hypothetical protein
MAEVETDSWQPPFVLVLPFRPASAQGGGKAKYQARLKHEITRAFGGREQLRGDLYVRITHLHRVKTRRADVDNIVKPILDAMKGTVFVDDAAVRQCITESIYLPDGFTVADNNRPSPGFDALANLLTAEDPPHFMYVEVGTAPGQRIAFGPLEG